jgi:hypothetical protein
VFCSAVVFIERPARLCDIDVREDVGDRELVLLALRRLALVGGERGDVDQPGDAAVPPGGGDEGSAVRVADENDRALTRPSVRVTVATSPSSVSRPCWLAITS